MGQAVREATELLAAAGVDSPRAEAELFCAAASGRERGTLPAAPPLDEGEWSWVRERIVARATTGAPLQYLLGSAPSGRLDLWVGPGVFIPRPETELLVEAALRALPPARPGTAPLVVDLCAGSGTLCLEIAHARPDARVIAVELYAPALDWLRRNAAERVESGDTPVRVVAGDATDPELLAELRGSVDVVVSNPPYIPEDSTLPAEVGGHEPHTALFGGPDGLAVIRPLVAVTAGLLRPGGLVALEHDDTTQPAVTACLEAAGAFGTVDAHTDLAGRPRYVTAVRSAGPPGRDAGAERGTTR